MAVVWSASCACRIAPTEQVKLLNRMHHALPTAQIFKRSNEQSSKMSVAEMRVHMRAHPGYLYRLSACPVDLDGRNNQINNLAGPAA